MIYLDHNSTTPLSAEAAEAMSEWQGPRFGNPASQHGLGRRARQRHEQAREAIARLLGADIQSRDPDRLIFTSGGSEANNLALLGICGALEPRGEPGEVVISAIEHPSITAPAERLERLGWTVHRLPVRHDGVIDLAALEPLLNDRTRLVSVMLANNETGVVQPVAEVVEICSARGVPVHTDAVQAAGKLPLDFRPLGASAMTIAAHKFGGPLGIGALVVRADVALQPLILGGFQQQGARGGTESVALAVGMQAALEAWDRERQERARRMQALRDRFEAALARALDGELIAIGAPAPRLPHTSCLALLGLDRQALVMALDLAGVAASTGSACASGSSEPSPVLIAMGRDEAEIASAVRFSLGAHTTDGDIDTAIERIAGVCRQMQSARPHSARKTV